MNSTFTEHTITEALEDGIYYWRARTKDVYHVASNYSVIKSFKIDVTKPVGNITIEEDILSVNDKLVNIAIYASDNASGVADMQIIGDRGNEGPWEEYKTEKRIALTPLDGLKKISVRFRDNAGIVSELYNDTIYFDLKGPFDIDVTSPTHPNQLVYYNSTLPVFSWNPPYEVTAIKGYSYTVDSTPLTEPTKVLYNQNSDLTGTYPGEFAGLSEGKWYFHITPCDIYDQWGNTTHFRFNIDSVAPAISEISPLDGEWYRRTEIRVEATFTDADGYGLDTESIAYSYRKSGEGTFSGWTGDGIEFDVLEEGIDDNPVKVTAWVELDLVEGDRNAVMWRINDISGNGPIESERHAIKVDLTPVTFSDPLPAHDEVSKNTLVSAGLTISDTGGSGVDGKTVEYSISAYGDDEKYFINWTNPNNNMVKETLVILQDIEFVPGRNNYIKWRAKDAVGNDFAVSDAVRVWVNSAPTPVIALPYDDEKFEEGAAVRLNASGTEDNEGDELSYYWEIKGKTSKKIVFRGWGPDASTALDQQGKYSVYLHVDDGLGFNESLKLTIEVTPKPTGIDIIKRWEDTTDSDGDGLPDWWEKLNGLNPDNPNDGSDEQKDLYRVELSEHMGAEVGEENLLSRYWWVLLIVGFIIVALIVGIIVIVAKKKRKEEEEKEMENALQQRYSPEPYPIGSRDFHNPQYSEMYASHQSQSAYSPAYGSSGGWGSGQERSQPNYMKYPMAQLPPAAGASPVPERPALPMYTGPAEIQPVQDMAIPPQSPITTAQGTEAQSASPSFTPPAYSLPAFTSEQGTQNLNLMALPPAPPEETSPGGQIPIAGDGTSGKGLPGAFEQSGAVQPIYIPPLPGINSTPSPEAPPTPAPAVPVEGGSSPLDNIFSSPPPGLSSPEPPVPDMVSPPPIPGIPQLPSIQCHGCGSMNQVMTAVRPTTVTCVSCGTQIYLAQ